MKQIFESGELEKNSVTEEYSATASDGKNYKMTFYNLDAIISVGYRVNSAKATKFRIWATNVLKEYIKKGFVMDDERRARRHVLTTMAEWKQVLENYLKASESDVLPDAGSITHEEAETKALGEYEKFRRIQDQALLSDFDKFIEGLEQGDK